MSFKKGFFNSLLVSGGYNYTTQAIVFFSTVITSRLLTPESFGFVGLITVFTGFVSIFSDSGISLAVIRSDYGNIYHRSVDSLSLVLGIILCLLTCLLAYPISLFYHSHSLFLPTITMSLIFILKSMSLVRGALLAKTLQFATIGKITLTSSCLQVLLTVVTAYCGWGYWSLIVPQIFSSLLILMLYERTVKLGFKFSSFAHIKVAYQHTKKTIGNLMGFNMINYWARNLDNLIVGKLYGVMDLGIYNRAYNLLVMPLSLVTGLIGNILYPSLKKLKSEGGNINREYLFILKMITVLTFPVSLVLILFPEDFVLLLWGKSWIGVSKLLPYFGLLVFSQSLLSTTGNILVLLEKEKVMRISGWLSAVSTISGIIYGSFTSITAIAQFYSLAFIVVVLPFNLFYLFINALRFDKKEMIWFWAPIILISLMIWLSCYFEREGLKVISVIALFFFITANAKSAFGEYIVNFFSKKLVFTRAIEKIN